MKKETTNITALRSKAWITESLLALMNEKEFSKITITEIIRKADLTRQTFYRNFNSKEDVLYEYISNLYQECFNEIDALNHKNMKLILITYFNYWHKNKYFLMLIIRNNLNYKITDFYYPFMNKYFDDFIISLHAHSNSEYEYIRHFFLGGLLNVKMQWMNNGFIETSESLADLVLKFINPNIYNISNN